VAEGRPNGEERGEGEAMIREVMIETRGTLGYCRSDPLRPDLGLGLCLPFLVGSVGYVILGPLR